MIEVRSPFPVEALPRVWGWIQSFRDRVTDDYSPKTLDAFVEKCLEDMQRTTTWAIYRDGELGGMVSCERWTPMLATMHCLFKRELWGSKTTRPALEEILTEVFAGGTTKISMAVFSDNKAILGLLHTLGAVVEGRYKNHTLRGGKLVDMTALALFQEGFEHARTIDRSRNRGDRIDRRGRSSGEVEDIHVDDDTHLVPGDAGPAEAAERLQHEPAD